MRQLFTRYVAQLDSAYRNRSYFTGLKARLLAGFSALILIWVPLNIAKLAIVDPPAVAQRLVLNAIMVVTALFALYWVRRGRLERAANGLALALILPMHVFVFFSSNYVEPLSVAIQLFAFDLIFLFLALAFASRWTAVVVLIVSVTTHIWFHYHALHRTPLIGTVEFAADTLLRDGLFAIAITFCLGLTIVIMIEAAQRRSEEALRQTTATNENLERLVAERTQALEAATQRAQDSARAKSEFLANMSHEIRTPLHGIIASADLVRRRADLPPPVAEQVRLIADSGDLLLHLLGDILDFSKIEAGQLELERQPFALGALVTDTASLLAPKAHSGAVHLDVLLAPSIPLHVEGDSHRLRQVLLNLAVNAIKFTPVDGRVDLLVSLDGHAAAPNHTRLRFEVRDTGIGMDAATIVRVFERFTQADTSTTRRFGGSGLGLAISSHLVRLMGGKLDVNSTPGRGSSFFFTLELPLSSLPVDPPPNPEVAPRVAGLRVLIVEDNPVNCRILAAQLTQLGCEHREANDGEQALAILARAPLPDLILMDCHMPLLDGWETTRRLRAWASHTEPLRRQAATIPIVALTAAALPDERQRCLDAGMNDFIAKPVKLPELRDALARFVPVASAS